MRAAIREALAAAFILWACLGVLAGAFAWVDIYFSSVVPIFGLVADDQPSPACDSPFATPEDCQ